MAGRYAGSREPRACSTARSASKRTRRGASALTSLLALTLFSACQHVQTRDDKPTIVVALGLTPEQVQQRSTLTIPWWLVPVGSHRTGGATVTAPHRLIYEDESLRLVLPDAGNTISMPTSVSVRGDRVIIVSASVLGEYVTLKDAVAASRKLLSEVERQGFVDRERHARFYLARANVFAKPRPPDTVASFEDMERAFLDSRIYLRQCVVFALKKEGIEAELWLTNMRRHFSEAGHLDERVRRELDRVDHTFLQHERAYYLEISIARPVG